MNKLKLYRIFLVIILSIITLSCTEPIDIGEKLSFEDALVVEATITNEFKYQKILLTRTFRFEDNGPQAESNATVNIADSANNTYTFTENEPGEYISTSKFKAIPNTDYQLLITTNDNKKYATANIQLTNKTQINNLYASREINRMGNESMQILIESFDPDRNSNYYRYSYEETYKIIAPYFVNLDFVILQDEDGNDLAAPGFGPRSNDEKECYNTVSSNTIIQTSTTALNEDRVSKFIVRSIPTDDAIISSRYSILVRQYVQSIEAFTYYNILNQLSGSSSLFSQIQPGFINSNIYSVANKDEKILGFFEISSVSEKRIFFNYKDFFPNEPLPPYFIQCNQSKPEITTVGGGTPLLSSIRIGAVKYFLDNAEPSLGEGPYITVPTPCGDCTQLGSTEKPDFWID